MHRFADASSGDSVQFPGWPITVRQRDNDGRKPIGFLKTIKCAAGIHPVVQVVNQANNEVLYTIRAASNSFRPPVYKPGLYTIKVGFNKPDATIFKDEAVKADGADTTIEVSLPSPAEKQ